MWTQKSDAKIPDKAFLAFQCVFHGREEGNVGWKGPDERRVLEEEKKKKREEKAVKRPQENRKGQRDR